MRNSKRDPQERELLLRCQAGDEAAFSILVQENKERIFRHCLSIVHDEEMAQDLTQEAFLHAFQHLNTFRMEARFSTWIWRIAHNLSLNFIKKQRPFEKEFKEELLIPHLENHKINEDLLVQVQVAMQRLSPRHRAVFEMYDLQHIPQKEIAASLGIAHGTVRSRLHYARKQIRKFLEEA